MKVLCSGDWHLGKIVNNFSMLEEQAYILNTMKQELIQQEIDVLIIAGDLYDRSIPPTEAVVLLNDFLTEVIVQLKKKVLIISGNHDSNERLQFGSSILKEQGLFIVSSLDEMKVTLNDEFGPIHFYLIPFAHPFEVRNKLGVEPITTYHEAMIAILNTMEINEQERNVAIYHGFVTASHQEVETSDSERIVSVGTMANVDYSLFSKFDFTILGHLHGAQKMGSDTIRYTGSPLKYSFSEVNQKKSVLTLDILEKGTIKQELIPLVPQKEMKKIEGYMDDLLQKEEVDTDYIHVTLLDTNEIYEPLARLRIKYPNIMQMERKQMIVMQESTTRAKEGFEKKDLITLFNDFYEGIVGSEMNEKESDYIETINALIHTEVTN